MTLKGASSNLVVHPIDLFSNLNIFLIIYGQRGSSKMDLKAIKRVQKKSPEELQEYLHFKRRGSMARAKKGKGSFNRKLKHKNLFEIF